MVKKIKDLSYYEAVGRRKQSVARVRLYLIKKSTEVTVGKLKIKAGEIFINGKSIDETSFKVYKKKFLMMPLILTKNEKRFAVSIIVNGGGTTGQLDAMVHGIARALLVVDTEAYRSILKTSGMLTRDPRKKETRKVGTGGKARRMKQSPKR
ncbi:30S ribosomal protein S9 [Candidatus Roizmanbacteria bacterium CG06_land_8_20_14_3_00_34_14]|uniref:30S ribosomal protein S9 n=2 Tax=Candidatus Roizmaniibacteriota TaxID=1752723 RepID=A0A2M7AV75_9BACT|nr:MAG: 30S ribosomal protein S9 [Candidatus Roizmanbacteria bacterium CG07_land_8_20_14_0_80_34_15]PIU74512.1 MAG: 30S ribosomal protein S9 [Candidatus Roizmanbacteria bacterium CG06_land_8_20_14_3_00_34_14]